MVTPVQTMTAERTSYLLLHLRSAQQSEEKKGNSLESTPRPLMAPIPLPSERAGHLQSRAAKREAEAFKEKLAWLFQQVRALEGGERWIASFNTFPETRRRAICLAMLANTVPHLKALVCEILQQFMLPAGESAEDFLLVAKAGASKYKETLAKGALLDQTAQAHFDASRSFASQESAARKAELEAIKAKMQALQTQLREIQTAVRGEINVLVPRVNALAHELQTIAANNPDLGEKPLRQLTADYQALMDQIDGLK